jgi:tetratricopeptide (TPR) repeat protein
MGDPRAATTFELDAAHSGAKTGAQAGTQTGARDPAPGSPQAAEIRDELSRIVASPPFRGSLRLTSFLTYVVEATLAGKGERIKSYTIALEALGRDSSFDPQADPIVRVEAGRLRRALAHYYAIAGRDDPVVIDLPRGNYVPTFRRRRTPVGLRKLPFSGRRALYRFARRRRRLVFLITVVALVVSIIPNLAMSAWHRLSYKDAAAHRNITEQILGPSLPVLFVAPVTTSGTPPATAVSGTMFRQRLIDALARFDEVTVLGEQVPRDQEASREGGNAQAPGYRITATVHYYSDGSASVAVLANDTSDGTVIWSKTYDVAQQNVPAPPRSRIIRDVATTLLQPFGVIEAREHLKRATADSMSDPFRCLLDSREYIRGFDFARHDAVRACLEQAVRTPNWATGFVQLARLYLRDYQFGAPAQGPDDASALDLAFSAANRALEIKATDAQAYGLLQDVLLARGDVASARIAGETAVRLNPYDRTVVFGHAFLLVLLDEADEAMALMNQVDVDNPVMPARFHFTAALAAYLRDDLPTALMEVNKITNQQYPLGLMLRGLVAAKLGDRTRARAAVDRLYALYPAWSKDLRGNLGRFLPVSAMADRIAAEFKAATAVLTQ